MNAAQLPEFFLIYSTIGVILAAILLRFGFNIKGGR